MVVALRNALSSSSAYSAVSPVFVPSGLLSGGYLSLIVSLLA